MPDSLGSCGARPSAISCDACAESFLPVVVLEEHAPVPSRSSRKDQIRHRYAKTRKRRANSTQYDILRCASVMINPPIITLSPSSTRSRVEISMVDPVLMMALELQSEFPWCGCWRCRSGRRCRGARVAVAVGEGGGTG